MIRFFLSSSILLLLNLFSIHIDVFAQQERITPDRPGFSTGTFTVPVGTFYLETGYQMSFRNSGDSKFSEIPVFTLRTGLTSSTELFLDWDGISINHNSNQTDTELPGIGLKQRILESESLEFTLVSVLNGSRDNNKYFIDPMLGLMWESEFTDFAGHFGGIQFESETDDTGREWSVSLALGLEFELHEKWAAFTEYYNIYLPSDEDLFHASEFGLLFYPNPTIQLDLYGGIGFSGEMAHYIGAGISISF